MVLGRDGAVPAATTPTGLALRTALAAATTYVSASLAYPLGTQPSWTRVQMARPLWLLGALDVPPFG